MVGTTDAGRTYRVAPRTDRDNFVTIYAPDPLTAKQIASKRMGGKPVMFEALMFKPVQTQRSAWKKWWAFVDEKTNAIQVKARNKREAMRKAYKQLGSPYNVTVMLVK